MTQKLKIAFGRVENIVGGGGGEGENAGYQHFMLVTSISSFPTMFLQGYSLMVVKGLCVKDLKSQWSHTRPSWISFQIKKK